MAPADSIPDDIDALRAELAVERTARREAEARAIGAEAMVTHLKFMIAKLEHHRYAPSSERGRKLLDFAAMLSFAIPGTVVAFHPLRLPPLSVSTSRTFCSQIGWFVRGATIPLSKENAIDSRCGRRRRTRSGCR